MGLFSRDEDPDEIVECLGHTIQLHVRETFAGEVRSMLEVSAAIGCRHLDVRAFAGSYFIAAGRQDATTGHAAFDDRYIVKTDDEAMMRFWLGPPELDAILSTYEPTATSPFEVEIRDGTVRFRARPEFPFPDPDPPVARRQEAIEACAFLAGLEARVLAAWRARAEAIGGALIGERWTWTDALAVVVAAGEREETRIDFPVELDWTRRRGLRTRAWTRRFQPGEPLVAVSRVERKRSERPHLASPLEDACAIGPLRGTIAPPLPARPRALDAPCVTADVDWIVIDATTIAVGWERIEPDVDRLRAGVELVHALAAWAAPGTDQDGPYR